ncbi:MAG: hypothetical protein RJA10_1255, partial [Pseudomonadota bacterium]
ARDPRRLNRSRVLSAIRHLGPASRAEISERTGFTEAAVSRITRELIDAGVLMEATPPQPPARAAGRPQVKLSLVGAAAHVLALEIAANAQSVSLMDLHGAQIAHQALNLLDGLKPEQALMQAAEAGLALIAQARLPRGAVVGAGVGIAGAVDPATGVIVSAPNIGWQGVPVAEPLARRLGLAVQVESRPSALLLAEQRLGVAQGARHVLLLNVALGIGGAVMLDGRLARGRDHAAGQIAHMPMWGATGLCLCSRRGCLDTLASGRAVLARLGRLSPHTDPGRHGPLDAQSLRDVAAAAGQGEPQAHEAFRTAGTHLGTALRWAAAALQPELIVLAGVAAHCTAYVDGVRQTFADAQDLPIAIGRIGNEVAAGELALDRFVFSGGFELPL